MAFHFLTFDFCRSSDMSLLYYEGQWNDWSKFCLFWRPFSFVLIPWLVGIWVSQWVIQSGSWRFSTSTAQVQGTFEFEWVLLRRDLVLLSAQVLVAIALVITSRNVRFVLSELNVLTFNTRNKTLMVFQIQTPVEKKCRLSITCGST